MSARKERNSGLGVRKRLADNSSARPPVPVVKYWSALNDFGAAMRLSRHETFLLQLLDRKATSG